MQKFIATLAAGVAVATMVPAAASAATIDLTFAQDTTDQPFNAFTQTFILPSNYTNAVLHITSLLADDAAVASLNGNRLYGAGIFGPGVGNFYFTANGTSVPFVFADNSTAANPVNLTFSSPFTIGTNTFTLFVNNNNSGINSGNGTLTGGPGQVNFVGNVTYDIAAAVPEPTTWALMLTGFGMIGFAARRRSAVKTSVTFA